MNEEIIQENQTVIDETQDIKEENTTSVLPIENPGKELNTIIETTNENYQAVLEQQTINNFLLFLILIVMVVIALVKFFHYLIKKIMYIPL